MLAFPGVFMIVCARCGAQNQPTNKFCLSCGAPVQQVGQPAPAPAANPQPAPAPQPWGAPPPPAPAGQWGQSPQAEPQPPAWGQQPPAPAPAPWGQPQQAAPAWGQPPQAPSPQQGWGQQPANAPAAPAPWGAPPAPAPQPGWNQGAAQGGFAPAGGFGPAPAHLRVGSPEGLNPFGATVGPPEGVGAPPAAPAQPPWPGDAFAPTNPQEEAARAGGASYGAPVAPPQVVASAPAPAPAPPTRPSTHPVAAASDPEFVDPHAPRSLAGFLVSYEGNELGVFYPIYQGQNLVGRKGAAPGLQIEIEHGTTSSRHATLFAAARPGRVKIEDMGSTNGTFVGDLMLERGKKHELKDGDVVRFGGYVTIIKIV